MYSNLFNCQFRGTFQYIFCTHKKKYTQVLHQPKSDAAVFEGYKFFVPFFYYTIFCILAKSIEWFSKIVPKIWMAMLMYPLPSPLIQNLSAQNSLDKNKLTKVLISTNWKPPW